MYLGGVILSIDLLILFLWRVANSQQAQKGQPLARIEEATRLA
jgi:hypothetical protein